MNTLLPALKNGAYDAALTALYTSAGLEEAKKRVLRVCEGFLSSYGSREGAALFSGPGRTEIGGNHTDHQHGHVLCGSVDMDMLACAAPNGTDIIHIWSEGYSGISLDVSDLSIRPEESNSSAALVRGVARAIQDLGYTVGGFDAWITSNVLSGSGLSSSAAYEVLIGNIINRFFCAGELDAIQIAKVGQYAENVYFGKPCGLMDQMGASVGGAVFIDFNDPADPVVERLDYDFAQSGHVLCIVDTGSSHGDLTDDYADITREMGAVAAHFGKTVLRDVPLEQFQTALPALPALREECGDRAVLRAMHFFADDRAAIQEAAALRQGDFQERFLNLVNASGLSSSLRLQNTWSISNTRQQAIPLALTVGEYLLDGTGAIRVHGGGFAGTIQAFVPEDRVALFKNGMEELFGSGKCHILRIRPQGGCVILREGEV